MRRRDAGTAPGKQGASKRSPAPSNALGREMMNFGGDDPDVWLRNSGVTAKIAALGDRLMQAVILAGGLGTRLGEETSVRPKPMVEIGGMPISRSEERRVGKECVRKGSTRW